MAATLMLLSQEELLKLGTEDIDMIDAFVRREITTSAEVQKLLRKRLDKTIKARLSSRRTTTK